MGKLVVFLKDATPVEVPLDKERVTIGRRPDNDVCLPHPAVSGEHAAVVTILADSFLEDLGSTNGTLVNGKPVAKHFLRDRDQIDIGRQLIVYLADVSATADAAEPYDRADRRDLVQAVEAWVEPRIAVPIGAALDGPSADLEAELDRVGAVRVAGEAGSPPEPARRRPAVAPTPPSGPGRETAKPGVALLPPVPTPLAPAPDAEADPVPASTSAPVARSAPGEDAPTVFAPARKAASGGVPPPAAAPEHGRVEVLSGPQAGRMVAMTGDVLVLGRVGTQVAALLLRDDAVVLVPREGPPPSLADGTAVGAEGLPLEHGSAFDVAGVRVAWRAAG